MADRARSRMETILHFFQTLAIVAAGCWTIYQYTTFNSKQQELELKQSELTLKQATLTAEQQELSREYERGGRLSREVKVDAFKIGKGCDGRSLYEVTYTLKVTNSSQATHDLSALILDTYIGIPKDMRGDADAVIPLGNPAHRFNAASETPGYVTWSRISEWGSVSPTAEGRLDARWPATVKLIPRGGFTGVLRPGQVKQFSETFRVLARPSDYIGLYAQYCLNLARSDDDLIPRWDYFPLRPVEMEKDASDKVKLPCGGASRKAPTDVAAAQRTKRNA